MKLLYFFDDKIKPITMRGKFYCKPEDTGILCDGISAIREYDVNLWLYTKNGRTIAFDTGHINYDNIDSEFEKIKINPDEIEHLFLTHLDVDHAGGIDITGRNIFPNAHVYMGADEEKYMTREIRRKAIFHNCVKIADGWTPIKDISIFKFDGIKVEAIPVLGHTVGHTVYIVDDKILISGDCLAINENGGYAFFNFFNQDSKKNKESLVKLRDRLKDYDLKYVCTGHSGIHPYSEKIFKHIDKSATFGKRNPFHKDGEYNPFDKKTKPDYRNWVPASLLRNFIGGTVITFILFIIFSGTDLVFSGTPRIICGIILGIGVLILLFSSVMLSFLYRTFDYRGKRKLAKTIIEGVAQYVEIPYGGVGLDVGCGSGALTIACARRNPKATMVGCDIWSGSYKGEFTKQICQDNARAEDVSNVRFEVGNAVKLPFEDESFDVVTSNYVYHNIMGHNKQKLLLETLRVLKKGGVFVIHDIMKKSNYSDIEKFIGKLKAEGYEDIKLIDTTNGMFVGHREAKFLSLVGSTLLIGRKFR